MQPNSVPTSVPRSIGIADSFSSALLGSMSLNRTGGRMLICFIRLTWRRKSAMPNTPMAIEVISMPSASSGVPKSKRSMPVVMSVPTLPNSMPITVMAIPFTGDPRDMVAPTTSPRSMIENRSAGPNCNAARTRSGAANIITIIPTDDAKNEASMVRPSAMPPLPFWVSGKPSRQVTACGGWDGRLSRMAPIAPPYCEP